MARRILPHAPTNSLTNALLAMGEVVIDETTGGIRIGDGSTLGGKLAGEASALAVAASLAASDGATRVFWQRTNGVSRSVAVRLDEVINVKDFGAVGDNVTDNAAAIVKARNAAMAAGKPMYFPSGNYRTSDTVWAPTGLVGDGMNSTLIWAKDKASFPNGKPVVRIGYTGAEATANNLPALAECITVRDFQVRGMGTRTALRYSDPATMQYDGNGLLFDERAHSTMIERVKVMFCFKGIVFNNNTGHLGLRDCVASNNWYNLYWDSNTGDYKLDRCTFTGAFFATLGAAADNLGDGVHLGGIFGLFVNDTHFGFAPYVYYQKDGTSTIGLVGCVIDARHEQVGNQAYRTGVCTNGQRNSNGNIWKQVGHSWTDATLDQGSYDAYTIKGDGNYPIQQTALSFQLMQGPDCKVVDGGGWVVGTTGYHTVITTLFVKFFDENGTNGYQINGGDTKLLSTNPYTSTQAVGAKQLGADTGGTTLIGPFNVPNRVKNYSQAYLSLQMPVDNQFGSVLQLQIRVRVDGVTSGVKTLVYLPTGQSMLVVPPTLIGGPGSVLYLEIPAPAGGAMPVNFNGPIAGQITLRVANEATT